MSWLAPITAAFFFAGLISQMTVWAESVGGGGWSGAVQSAAAQRALAAEVFAAACVEAAQEDSGAVSSSITVTLPTGVILPTNAVCMTTEASSGRNVYAYVPSVPGAAAQIVSNTQSDLSWYAVRTAGTATSLVTGSTASVSSSIPKAYLLNWVLVDP
jgi:hypothetical protein